jgi:hypothetical protein
MQICHLNMYFDSKMCRQKYLYEKCVANQKRLRTTGLRIENFSTHMSQNRQTLLCNLF